MLTKQQSRRKSRGHRRTKIVLLPAREEMRQRPKLERKDGDGIYYVTISARWAEVDRAGRVVEHRGKKIEADTKELCVSLKAARIADVKDRQEAARVAGNWAWLHRWMPGGASALANSPMPA